MKTLQTQVPATNETMVEYINAYILKGNTLKPFTTDYKSAAQISQDKQSLEKKFKNETELSELVLNNGKTLFGEQTFLLDCLKKSNIEFTGGFMPDGLLFDLREPERPKLYFVEITLSQKNLADLFLRMTNLFSIFKNQESTRQFTATLANAIRKNISWRNKLKVVFGNMGTYEFLEEIFTRRPPVLLLMDIFKQELTGFIETYTETWGKYVKPILIRKFAVNGETVITMVPTLEQINQKLNGRMNKKAVPVKSTEADHTGNVSETVREVFLQIKEELLKVDSAIEFRVKQHYISLRKDRNLAFFQLGKKKLSIVVANPEKDTLKEIKHHEVRMLADSVKRFWNGNKHCFTAVLENKEHLEEIVHLLKKMVENGKREEENLSAGVLTQGGSDEPPWHEAENTLPSAVPLAEPTGSAKSNLPTVALAKAGKSQAKPGVKKGKKR